MTREEMIKKNIEKTLTVVQKMRSSNDISDTARKVRITNSLSLEVNCVRYENDGSPIIFQIYAVKNGKDIDCETIEIYRDFKEPIRHLLNCYI